MDNDRVVMILCTTMMGSRQHFASLGETIRRHRIVLERERPRASCQFRLDRLHLRLPSVLPAENRRSRWLCCVPRGLLSECPHPTRVSWDRNTRL